MFKSLCVYRKKYAEKEKLKWGLQSTYLAWLLMVLLALVGFYGF